MLYLSGGDLKEGKAVAFQEWVQDNEDTLAETAPDGWSYRGHYFSVHNFGPFDAAMMWEIENYAALDAARDHDDETQERLIGEMQGFFTEGGGQTMLLREAGDTRIVEPADA